MSGVSFEERSVALADKLWKGKRESKLELLVIDEAALKLAKGRWELFAARFTLRENCERWSLPPRTVMTATSVTCRHDCW